jgi:hypothetical protein
MATPIGHLTIWSTVTVTIIIVVSLLIAGLS